MFDILFGWRKASKCKKLIRRVQCRLKLLKNKRSTIVRQLRDDVAELLKHGHNQSAFDRVEQVIKDENLVAVYDQLENFCEFIIINLPYIRRNKDCPNDINEAVSTLIFASVRLGDLPELRSIRKLFIDRYGQRFERVALELLPGNLVNCQMREKLCTTAVLDEVKSKLMVEIAGNALKSGPLLLEYSSELQQLENESRVDPILGVETGYDQNDGPTSDALNTMDAERMIVYIDLSSEKKKFLKVESSMHKKGGIVVTSAPSIRPSGFAISGPEQLAGEDKDSGFDLAHEGSAIEESLSESSPDLPEEKIHLNDIREFESPVRKEGSFQDQRLFMFKSSVVSLTGKIDNLNDQGLEEQHNAHCKNASSRRFRKSKKVSGKRLLRRSISIDITSTKDVECAIYYGESCDGSTNYKQKYDDRRKHHKKIPIKEHKKPYFAQASIDPSSFIEVRSSFSFVNCGHSRSNRRCSSNNTILHDCSLENPCYFCVSDEEDGWNLLPMMPKKESRLSRNQCYYNTKPDIQEVGGMFLYRTSEKCEDAAGSPLFTFSHSRVSSPQTSKERKTPYLRATTMPVERPNDSVSDSHHRSNSFPFQQPGRCSPNQHVHPKLPDYDELAAKFTALKRANLQSEKQ